MFPEDAVGVDCRCTAVVYAAIAVHNVGIGDVNGIFARREGYAVGSTEAICYYTDIAGLWVKTVDLLRELRFGSESLLEAVYRIGKPD